MDDIVDDPPPHERLRPAIGVGYYCKACYYDLRGLTVYRCPECGQGFDPERPGSYSRVPRSEKLQETIHRTAAAIGSAFEPDHIRRDRELTRRIERLEVYNFELRAAVDALAELLIARGLVTPDEFATQLVVSRQNVISSNTPPTVHELAQRLEQMVNATPDDTPQQIET